MKFTSLASGSTGNAYVLESEGVAPLLIEAGISIKTLREKLNFGLSGLAGCLISHEHGDHSKSVKDLLKAGVDCYMSKATAEALDVTEHHRTNIVSDGDKVAIGLWTILPFDLEHDAPTLGYFVAAGLVQRLLFVPDTAYVKPRFKRASIIAIECNHVGEILSQNIQKGAVPAVVGHRVRRNHMELSTLIRMLKANDLSMCRSIYLLHLSDGNSDEARMVKEVEQATGIPTFAC